MIILYAEDVHEKYCLYTYLFYTNTALNNEPKKGKPHDTNKENER